MAETKKGDFIELSYTGYSNGEIFDSNIPEDLKKIQPEGKPQKTIIVVGEGIVVPGLDSALEGKEIGKEYSVEFSAKDGFGERKRDLVKTIPLKAFTEKNVSPKPGMVLNLDNNMARIITISGARVITDFNNPLAGKDLKYKFKITRLVEDEKEKVTSLFDSFLRFTPDFEIKEDKVIAKGPKGLKVFIDGLKDTFKKLLGKEITFEESSQDKEKPKKPEVSEDQEK